MILGLDIGSTSSKGVLLNDSGQIVRQAEVRCMGNQAEAVREVASRILPTDKNGDIIVGLTGCGRHVLDWPEGVIQFNAILSLAGGVARTNPESRSVIEIGGHASRWLLLSEERLRDAEPEIQDFAMNERCAAGSGAFIEQQASRLKMSIEEFSEVAAFAQRGSTVAGRCSVFAKTDMIHLQQKGTPVGEIAYGLFLALARNFVASILRGRSCEIPVFLTGGAVRNQGLVRAFEEVLGIGTEHLRAAANPSFTSAVGAAVNASCAGEPISLNRFENAILDMKTEEAETTTILPPFQSGLSPCCGCRSCEVRSEQRWARSFQEKRRAFSQFCRGSIDTSRGCGPAASFLHDGVSALLGCLF